MFNFTTQTVFNSIVKSPDTQGNTVKGANLIVSTDPNRPSLRIGNTRFDADNVESVQIKKPTEESLASVTFDMSKIVIDNSATETEIGARIVLYIGLAMNSQDSFYSNDLVYKGKPLYVEFKVKKGETAATIANRVKAVATKYLLFMTQEKLLDISVTSGSVTISAVNGYQIIKVAKLQKFDPNAKTFDCCNNIGDYVDVVTGVPVAYKTNATTGVVESVNKKMGEDGELTDLAADEVAIIPGLEAFGDYNWIIHNLRLPTAANTAFWSPTKDEMPAVGAKYTQFIIRLCKERDGIAGEVVGQRAVSVTTHVLYVANNYATLVEQELTNLVGANKIKTDADDVLENPYNIESGTSGNNTENTGNNTENNG